MINRLSFLFDKPKRSYNEIGTLNLMILNNSTTSTLIIISTKFFGQLLIADDVRFQPIKIVALRSKATIVDYSMRSKNDSSRGASKRQSRPMTVVKDL